MSEAKTGKAGVYGEPWTWRKPLGSHAGVRIANEQFIGDLYHPYGKRAIACVNACAGMDDPAEEIARLREALMCARAVYQEYKASGGDSDGFWYAVDELSYRLKALGLVND